MPKRCRTLRRAGLVGLIAITIAASSRLQAEETALGRYIAKPDSSYGWKVEAVYPEKGATTYVIKLTSQTWRTADEVDKPVWTHWLTVVRPDQVRAGTAFHFISGGSLRDGVPKAPSPRVS